LFFSSFLSTSLTAFVILPPVCHILWRGFVALKLHTFSSHTICKAISVAYGWLTGTPWHPSAFEADYVFGCRAHFMTSIFWRVIACLLISRERRLKRRFCLVC
jgi:hypothetical protein